MTTAAPGAARATAKRAGPDGYDAFLSYSHGADRATATALEHALQRVGVRWWQRSGLRVFRDDADLAAAPALWGAIAAELTRSRFLVLLASPAAAASPWVDREVDWWLTHRGADQFLLVVTDGELAWDGRTGELDHTRTTCLPPAFVRHVRTEPLYVDLRWARAGRAGRTSGDARFRDAVLAVAAPLHGVPKEVLEGSETRRRRRGVQAALVAGAAAVALVALAGMEAARARTDAARAAADWRESQSRALAAHAVRALAEHDVNTAIQLAVLGSRLASTEEARAALDTVVNATAAVPRMLGLHGAAAEALAFSDDGSRLASLGRDGSILVWETRGWRRVGPAMVSTTVTSPYGLRLDASGTHVLTWAEVRSAQGTALRLELRAVDSGRLVGRIELPNEGDQEWNVALSPGGSRVAIPSLSAGSWSGFRAELRVWAPPATSPTRVVLPGPVGAVGGVAFVDEQAVTAVVQALPARSMRALVWSWSQGSVRLGPLTRIHPAHPWEDGDSFRYATRGARGREFLTWKPAGGPERPNLWSIGAALDLHERPLPDSRLHFVEGTDDVPSRAVFDPAGRTVRIALNESWELWALDGQAPRVLARGSDSAYTRAWSPDSHWYASESRALDDRTITIRDLHAGARPVTTLVAGCSDGDGATSCARRLCEKVVPTLDSAQLERLFPIRDFQVTYHTYRALVDASTCARP